MSLTDYVLSCILYAAKSDPNRQNQCSQFLMEKDEEYVKIHEVFS
jgi:hypothetical protein